MPTNETPSDKPDQTHPIEFILDEATEQTILNYDETLRKKKRLVFIKLICYIVEIGILMIIAGQIPNPIWAAVIGIVGGILMTKLTDFVLKKIGVDEGAGEAADESGKQLVNSITGQFDILPDFLKDKIASIAYSGKEYKEEHKLKSGRKVHNTIILFIKARQQLRQKNVEEAKKLFQEVALNADLLKLDDLKREAQYAISQL
jgi:hypothetical protein